MADIGAPVVDPGADALFAQGAIQQAGGGQHLLFPGALAHADHNLAGVQQLNPGVAGLHAADGADRRILVYHLVHVVAQEMLGLVGAGQGNHRVKQVRPAEQRVDRVHGPHAEAHGHGPVGPAGLLHGGGV